ncbi:MAG TPA: hypothetical protein VF139_15260 [Candidatus Polarisedimenticolaceae bacterium]
MSAPHSPSTQILRFDAKDRLAHIGIVISFLGLSLTGLPLLFSHSPWSARLARWLGGFETAGFVHRLCAGLMIAVFAWHVARLLKRIFVEKRYSMLWGPDSLVPQPRDAVQMFQHMAYFVRLGPRPKFDHFTYWEKFDYWAVFWGMFIIGGSGLMLWFPEFFSLFLPGWVFNIGLVIHGEEALLATGFIFTIHFFNENLRPSRFPMNLVMFTGREELEELQHDRPGEYERFQKAGGKGWVVAPPPPSWILPWGRAFGTVAIVLGLGMLVLILWAMAA